MQGKKAKGRLESIQSLQRDIRFSLSLMGLDAKDPTEILQDLRHAALVRSVQSCPLMKALLHLGWDRSSHCLAREAYNL